MNDEAVYRTAPATPGLLKIEGVRRSTFWGGGVAGGLNKITPLHQEEGVWGRAKPHVLTISEKTDQAFF